MKSGQDKKILTVSELGRLGGQALVKKLGKEHMSKLGKKGMKSRWKK